MSVIVVLEIVGMYIVMNYSNDMDVYSTLVCVGLGVLGYLGGAKGVFAIMLYMMFWPFMLTYIDWMNKMVSSIKLNESLKKMIVLSFVMMVFNVSLMWLYLFSMTIAKGFVSIIPLGVYVFISLSIGMWIMLLVYLVLSLWVNVNYKVMLLSLLPMPVFFVKICLNWMLMYVVMLMGLVMLL